MVVVVWGCDEAGSSSNLRQDIPITARPNILLGWSDPDALYRKYNKINNSVLVASSGALWDKKQAGSDFPLHYLDSEN
ncbi:hypothetical protein E2C01_033680 [Portunus trituberculatus]|uniref:Uncharacterized protein n=1 Tax=Portunus trituberculatus TaxID=210409 RepID=A0A5B7F432_PORTR|nr:hypothetical protein [Portunus trituberculatus]